MSAYRSPVLNYFPIRAGGDVAPTPGGPPAPTGVDLYMRFAFAGAVCCSVTHGALTPVDVVKTRIQLEPEVYNRVCISYSAAIFALFLVIPASIVAILFANVRSPSMTGHGHRIPTGHQG